MWITWKHQDTDFVWPLKLEDKITIFYERVYGWQLHIADICANGCTDQNTNPVLQPIPHSDFATLQIQLSYFEMVAKYYAGYADIKQSRKFFKQGVRLVFPDLSSQSTQPVEEFLNLLYSAARCGLYHCAMTNQGIIIGPSKAAMEFDPLHKLLMINPHLLPPALKAHLASYRESLLDPTNVSLRQKFETRFDFDRNIKNTDTSVA